MLILLNTKPIYLSIYLVQVVGLFVYPVKSCRGIKVSAWNMTKQGLEFDRQWVVMEVS